MRVLLIDDHPKKYEGIVSFFKNGRHAVDLKWVTNFNQARVHLRDFRYDLTILDMSFDVHRTVEEEANFAGLAGLRVLQFMQRARINVPVIVCTSHSRYFDPDFGKIEGIDALRDHIRPLFGEFCLGCIFMGPDTKKWNDELRIVIDDANIR